MAAALCSLLIATVGIAAPTGSAAGRAASSPAIAPSRAPTVTVELDLIHHHKVAPNLVHDGFNGTWQTYFPVLLKPKHTAQFWNTSQSILELAPKVSYGHSTGIALFEEAAAPQVTVRVIGSLSPTYSSDGLEAYLYLSPLNTTSWAVPYYATNPEGANGAFMPCQGDMIFPYSHTPYIAAQWDPGYQTASCGASYRYDAFNLYPVRPAPSAASSQVVRPSDRKN
jgi:hypothetical protein